MSIMSSDVIDLSAKDGIFRADLADLKKQDLSISKAKVKRRGKVEYLTKQEINPILYAITDLRDKLYILLLWQTGIRVTESINIEKRHINPSTGRITIIWQKSRRWHEREVNAPKSLFDQLLMFSRSMKYDEKLFPFSRQRAEQITKKYFGVSPHVFRHSYGMNWVDQGLPIDVLQLQLGHKNIQTTMIYVHTSAQRAKKYVDKVEWT